MLARNYCAMDEDLSSNDKTKVRVSMKMCEVVVKLPKNFFLFV